MLNYGDMVKIINSIDVESIKKEARGLVPAIRTLDTMSMKEKKILCLFMVETSMKRIFWCI